MNFFILYNPRVHVKDKVACRVILKRLREIRYLIMVQTFCTVYIEVDFVGKFFSRDCFMRLNSVFFMNRYTLSALLNNTMKKF